MNTMQPHSHAIPVPAEDLENILNSQLCDPTCMLLTLLSNPWSPWKKHFPDGFL